jgi:hypothetical protein
MVVVKGEAASFLPTASTKRPQQDGQGYVPCGGRMRLERREAPMHPASLGPIWEGVQ